MLSGVPFLAVDYRLAPEYQGTTLAEDAYARVVSRTCAGFGVDTARIAIMGESGGGASPQARLFCTGSWRNTCQADSHLPYA